MRSIGEWNGGASEPRTLVCRLISAVRLRRIAALLGLLAVSGTAALAEPMRSLRVPDNGEVRALIIGIDAYRNVRPLKGAVADARDIESALRKMGTKDITMLVDAQADRDSILREIGKLVERTRRNDLIVLTIAGHGAQEPERIKGSEPDGMENVFLLPGFEATAAGSQQRILGEEFNHLIKQFEARGASVLFVADTCHGGGMVREIDPRAEEMSFRQVPRYTLTVDELKPISTTADALATELDFDNTAFLAAVDRKTKAPEVRIPGIPGLRGALSYAVARAVEGNADMNEDGRVTLKELFTNVRQVVYQLSDQRQNIVTLNSPKRDLDRDVIFLTRAVTLLDKPEAEPSPALPSAPMAIAARPIRLAALDGNASHFDGLVPRESRFSVVPPVDGPDLIWDPASHDVLAWGDVVAYRVEKNDLPSVIDRAAAVRTLKQLATKSPQPVRLIPDDDLHRDQTVEVEIPDAAGRALILFNISSDGTVQLLYPLPTDPPVQDRPQYRFPIRVQKPFGAEQVIAVTSKQRMTALEQALRQLDRRRAPTQVIDLVQRYAPPDARIGSTSVFTAP
jgi:hypothetical protein